EHDSTPLTELLIDPCLHFEGVPANGTQPQPHSFWEGALFHQVVDLRALQAGLGLDFHSTQDATLSRCQRRLKTAPPLDLKRRSKIDPPWAVGYAGVAGLDAVLVPAFRLSFSR